MLGNLNIDFEVESKSQASDILKRILTDIELINKLDKLELNFID